MAFVKVSAIFFFFLMALTLCEGWIDTEHACNRKIVHVKQVVQDSEPPGIAATDDRISGPDEIKAIRTSTNLSSTRGASHDLHDYQIATSDGSAVGPELITTLFLVIIFAGLLYSAPISFLVVVIVSILYVVLCNFTSHRYS
ncbi:hypothetical protein ACFX2I_027645 [Malus domestica]